MAIMYPKSLAEYAPTASERVVFDALKEQLPDTFEVFYSVEWSQRVRGKLQTSEADFIVTSPEYGFLCLEVKGGNGIRVDGDDWYVNDSSHGERKLNCSPYHQASKSMYYFKKAYENDYFMSYPGVFGYGVVFPFYSINENLSNKDKVCTIDCDNMSSLHSKIKKIFREWGGRSFGNRIYSETQHEALLELIRKRIAISAAAGALVKYKEQQLNVINRVQDNYIYLLSNIRQFYVKGGAGTGKTWIAMKMAESEAQLSPGEVLYTCASPTLAKFVRQSCSDGVDVFAVPTLLSNECKKYAAIFVDEAQDLTEETAGYLVSLLKDRNNSRLCVFYDDAQILQKDSFGDGFGIEIPPFLLRENIRNTQNIYTWAAEKTNLGTEEIANPVEGPTPVTEIIHDSSQLTVRLETIFKEYLDAECLPISSLVLLVDDVDLFMNHYKDGLAKWYFEKEPEDDSRYAIKIASVEEYKGLESDMIIYIHSETSQNMNYIAYTRAKYYLIELLCQFKW